MYHIYTFGKKSIQFLIMKPREAETMNEFTKCFFASQEAYLNEKGYRWDPVKDPHITFLIPNDNPKLLEKYNKLADKLNRQHAVRNWIFDRLHIDVTNDDIDDFLVKRV